MSGSSPSQAELAGLAIHLVPKQAPAEAVRVALEVWRAAGALLETESGADAKPAIPFEPPIEDKSLTAEQIIAWMADQSEVTIKEQKTEGNFTGFVEKQASVIDRDRLKTVSALKKAWMKFQPTFPAESWSFGIPTSRVRSFLTWRATERLREDAERKARENAAKPSKKISVGNEAKTAPKKATNARARRKVKPRNRKKGT